MADDKQERRQRILIVEDEWLIADDLSEQLEQAGLEVVGPAHSVQPALDLIENQVIDAALLDISLHSETSFPVARLLAARHIPFAFLTGYAQQELPPERRDHIVLNKPVERSALLSTVGKLLAG